MSRAIYRFRARGKTLELGRRTVLMGVVNVTPDSFSDGGRYLDADSAAARALLLVEAGADIIDIGGESTRPDADPVSAAEELARVLPVVAALAEKTSALLSIDTTKSEVAEKALEAGAHLVNDVSGGTVDARVAEVAARFDAGLVVTHRKGRPKDMQKDPHYDDLLVEVQEFLREAVSRAERAGVHRDALFVDPGIGFGKTVGHNLTLINELDFLKPLERPILVGPSRKSFIGRVLEAPVESRLLGTAAAVTAAILRGAHAVRVHDLPAMADVARVADAITNEAAS